jgi:hypothetical protein
MNRTREAGNRDEVEGVVASTLNAFRGGAVGFIDWLDARVNSPPMLMYSPIGHDPPQLWCGHLAAGRIPRRTCDRRCETSATTDGTPA